MTLRHATGYLFPKANNIKDSFGGKVIATEEHILAQLIQTLDGAVRRLAKGAHGFGDATLATQAPRCRLPSVLDPLCRRLTVRFFLFSPSLSHFLPPAFAL